ncbi:phage tail protein [Rhizobium sp. CB3060]|uniref:phage tail protein n=1 Tax=Rhizobium sp. CB3060 TaxID=3138255 RepID=UPI0021A70319|nr:phage tail protein [Rhizobium tropici]UWU19627.1 phage tail protein [Rhizobium tropici]
MKILILLLNVVGFWLMADAAHADPITAAIAAISQFIGSIGVIGKLVLTVAINVGLSLVEKALAKKDQPQQAGAKLEISMGDDHPMSFIIGSYATAGRRKYAGSWGEDGKTPNAYFTDVIEVGSLPNYAGERGLTSVWIDDQQVGVLWEEPHPDGRGFPVLQYRVKGKDYLWIKFLDGTQSGTDAFLSAKFGANPDRPWKTTMIGLGCQVVILTARYNTDLFSGIPAGLYQPHPVPLYDIRKDSSVGGNGAHRWDNPATWEPTSNPATMIYNLARGVYRGSEWVYGGQNIAAFCLPAANWMAAANACDAAVALDGGGSEPAFRAGYEVQCDQQPLDVVSELLKGCNGRMAEVGGIFKVLISTPGGAVYSFSDDDIVVTEEQDFQPFPSLSDTYNAIEATYPEPSEKWATKDAPGRYNADLEAQDGNRRLPAQIQLPAVPFANQVQRVGLAMIQDYRRFRVHQISLPPDAYPLEPNDVVSWTSARNGYDEKKFLVVKVEPQPNFLIVVTLKEVDPADYDWHSGLQLPSATGWIGPITPPSQPMVGWTVEPATVKDAGGIDRRPAIKISCAADMDDVERVWVQVRLKDTGDIVFDSDSTRYASPFSWVISGQWMLSNTDYEARGRYIPKSNRATDWSAWLSVKTPNVLIQTGDVLDGAIIASKIADAAVTAAKIMDEAVTNLKLADEAVSTAKLQVAAVTADVLASGAVISAKLADGAVTAAKLAQSAVDATSLASSIKAVEVVSSLPTTDNVEGRQVFLTTDGKLYRYYGGTWTAAVAAGDVNGTLNASQIADGAITNNKLAALAVDASKLADGSVSAAKLAANAVDTTKFASDIRPVEIVSSLPTTGNVEGRTVYLTTDDKLYRHTGSAWTAATAAADIAGQIVGTQISDGAVSTPKLAAGSVTANALAAGAVTADKIAANSITAGQIAAGAIGAMQLAASAVTAKSVAIGDFANMITNPFFDQGAAGTDGWLLGGTIAPSRIVGASGDPAPNYIRIPDANGGIDYAIFDPGQATTGSMPCSAGDSYYVEFYIRKNGAPTASFGSYLSVSDRTSANTVWPQVYFALAANVPTVWTKVQALVNIPATVANNGIPARFNLQLTARPGTADNSGSYDIAKPVLRKATGAVMIEDGAVTASKVAANAITADKIAANAITARSLVLQDWENLIPDNQMQSSDSWFSRPANAVINPVATQPFNSKGSLDYTYVVGPGYQLIVQSDAFPIVAGQQYLVSCQAIRTSGTKMGVWARVHWTDTTGQLLNPDVYPAIFDTSGGTTVSGLQAYTVTMTPPVNAFGAIFRIYVQRDFTDGNISFGGVSFLRKASANLLVDGSVVTGKIAAGAVTAGTIAANAVTAGTIAAGAVSASQIAADAVTADKIASNAVTTDALAVGSGKNLLQNASFSMGMDCWTYLPNGTIPNQTFRIRAVTESWAGPNCPTLMLWQNGANTGNNYWSDIRWGRPDAPTLPNNLKYGVPCAPGDWFEVSAYVSAHRCLVELRIQWIASDGVAVGYTTTDQNNGIAGSATNPDLWTRLRCVGAAPANTVAVSIYIRKYETSAGQTDSYMFLNKPMLCRCPPNAAEFTPWSDGGVVMIMNGGIVASAVTADKIATNAVTADAIAANAVTAGKIAAGAVTATTIVAGTITGDKLAANTIGASQIAAGAITAKQLVLTDFSNMADNGWQAGSITGWTTQNLQNFYNDNSGGDAAGYFLQSLGRDCAYSNFVAVSAGETYAFDVWVNNTDPNQANIYAFPRAPSGTISPVVITGTSTKNAWVRLQGKYTVPSGITALAMDLQVNRTAGTGSSCFWSKPVMRRAMSAELIVDGAVTANKISVNSLDALTANLGAVNISSAVIGTLQVGTSNISAGAVTGVGVGRIAGTQNIAANATVNLVSCVVNVAGDGRVVIDAMTLGQYNQNGGSQNSQPIGVNIFRDGTAIFSQTYYLGVVQTVVSGTGGSNGSTTQTTYTAGLVAVSGLYDAPGAGNHTYILQIYCPGNTIGWNESNITATALKR